MRIGLIFDMESAGHIGTLRETFPVYPEYWDTGRRKMTDDVVAAATGLLEAGASEVAIVDHHGATAQQWTNIVAEALPDGAYRADDFDERGFRDRVDAMFFVGAHGRGGQRSFLSHTILPGLRLRLEGELLSEQHWWAWTGDLPLLGIVGSRELGENLGSLRDVPFLAVQASANRHAARPVLGSPRETSEAIRAFAAVSLREATKRRTMTPQGPIRLEASVHNGDDGAASMLEAGWVRTSASEFRIEADAWRDDAETIAGAIEAAAGAAVAPYGPLLDWIDASSREAALGADPERLAALDAVLTRWTLEDTVEWITPDVATHLEGMVERVDPTTRPSS